MKHTELPWRTFLSGSDGVYILPDTGVKREDMKFIAKVNGRDLQTDQENAEFIARACNSHEKLVAAARDAFESLSRLPDTDGAFRVTCISQLRAALLEAEREA